VFFDKKTSIKIWEFLRSVQDCFAFCYKIFTFKYLHWSAKSIT